MDLSHKLQELRKQKELTQEELAQILFVSRTAISRWESGRGYPSIDSLKAIAAFFSISVDELLSGEELLAAAENDGRQKQQYIYDAVFGMLDCAIALLFFAPLFGQEIGNIVYHVSLLQLAAHPWYINVPYTAIILSTILCGIAMLALQNCTASLWVKHKRTLSLSLSACGCFFFMISLQPYAGTLCFLFLLIKGVLLLKHR